MSMCKITEEEDSNRASSESDSPETELQTGHVKQQQKWTASKQFSVNTECHILDMQAVSSEGTKQHCQ